MSSFTTANFAAAKLPTVSASFASKLQHSLAALKPPQQRAVCTILGAAVADAATRPFHWVYNRTHLETTIGPHENVEFWPQSISPYYTLPTGRRSCYNDLGVAMLRALPSSEEGIAYDEKSFTQALLTMFATNTEYAEAMLRRKEEYDPSKRTEERAPIEGPWQQAAVTAFLEDMQAHGKPSGNPKLLETDGLCSTIPLIARLATRQQDSEGLLKTVHTAASVLSSNPISLVHTLSAAMLIASLIEGNKASSELFLSIAKQAHRADQSWIQGDANKLDFSKVYNELLEVDNSLDSNYVDTVEIFGKPCANPGSFMGAVLACLQAVQEEPQHAFVNGIRKVIRGGGCNCSRANLAGALLGASCGVYVDVDQGEALPQTEIANADNRNGIPLSWMLRTDSIEEILDLALHAVQQ